MCKSLLHGLSGDFLPGLQGRRVHTKLDCQGLIVAMFTLGISDVTCSPQCEAGVGEGGEVQGCGGGP